MSVTIVAILCRLCCEAQFVLWKGFTANVLLRLHLMYTTSSPTSCNTSLQSTEYARE